MTKEWLNDVARSALGYREALEATYTAARDCLERGIHGDFVECGVYAGAHCAVMALAILEHDGAGGQWKKVHSRRVHLFDSFQGLPAAAPVDEEIWAHHGATTGEAACSLDAVKSNMQRWGIPDELLVYHPGWFSETVPHAI